MRILVAVLAASLALGFSPGAMALVGDPPGKDGSRAAGTPADEQAKASGAREALPDAVEPSRAEQLDALFETLKTATTEEAADAATNSIASLWLESGSDTVDLLMEWTLDAVKEKNFPLALDYLDRILTLKPEYIEGWNTRATVYFMMENYGRALADIEKTLALEPRHFGALTGLAAILRKIGDDERALEVYRRVLAVDPHLPHVKEAIDQLSGKGAGGRDI